MGSRGSCCRVLVLFPSTRAAWLSMANRNMGSWERLQRESTSQGTELVPPWNSGKWNRKRHQAESLADTNYLNVRNTNLYFTLSKIIHQSNTERQTHHGKTSPCTVCGKEEKLLSSRISHCIWIFHFYR